MHKQIYTHYMMIDCLHTNTQQFVFTTYWYSFSERKGSYNGKLDHQKAVHSINVLPSLKHVIVVTYEILSYFRKSTKKVPYSCNSKPVKSFGFVVTDIKIINRTILEILKKAMDEVTVKQWILIHQTKKFIVC